jgi:ATP-dependent protease HslVU (ClpYQ) peptidase subunit
MMYSLGHAGSARESTALIDIPGVFVNKSGEKGLQAVLKDCSFSAKHNFNLLRISRLLHKQEWKIICGDESLIHIENGKGEVIDFNIVVPTEKGAIYACKFVCAVEVVTASAENTMKVNINIAHCLLGHQNEDSVQIRLQRNSDGFSHVVY